jgi:hypothetical protein
VDDAMSMYVELRSAEQHQVTLSATLRMVCMSGDGPCCSVEKSFTYDYGGEAKLGGIHDFASLDEVEACVDSHGHSVFQVVL